MTQCCCWSHMGMGMSRYCWVAHFCVCKMFFLVLTLLSNVHLSIGTVWKSSSSMSEDSGEILLELVEVFMLSSLKDRRHRTDLAGECLRLQVDVAGLHGVLCTRLKEACSKLDTWCMHGILHKGVGTSSLEPLL